MRRALFASALQVRLLERERERERARERGREKEGERERVTCLL